MFQFYFILIFLLVLSARTLAEGEAMQQNSEILDFQSSSQIDTSETYDLRTAKALQQSIPIINLEVNAAKTVEIVMERGYHIEMHPVTTEDGYILTLHRIPYPKGRNSGPTGRPVFILHGLVLSSAVFVLLPSGKALAFLLADLGYDVWLGNSRGTTYSLGHVTLDSSHHDHYWKFSFDEMGRYDSPAFIDYILAVTEREKLIYIGHSQGTRTLFICLHYHPEYNDKIELMVAMAPVTTLAHTKSLFNVLAPLQIPYRFFIWLFWERPHLMSQEGMYSQFLKKYCLESPSHIFMCHYILYSIAGADYENMNPDLIKILISYIPAGVSLKTLIHAAQSTITHLKNPEFNLFNYGWIGNLNQYGQLNPPAYNLSKVTLPVYIFYARNDKIVPPKDVEWTASKISNVKEVILVKDRQFSHMDFIFHHNAKELVYDQIIEILPPP